MWPLQPNNQQEKYRDNTQFIHRLSGCQLKRRSRASEMPHKEDDNVPNDPSSFGSRGIRRRTGLARWPARSARPSAHTFHHHIYRHRCPSGGFVRRRVQFLAKATREWPLPFNPGGRADGDVGRGLWACSHSVPPHYAIRRHACTQCQLSRFGLLWPARTDSGDRRTGLASSHRRQSRHQRADGPHNDCPPRSDGRNKA